MRSLDFLFKPVLMVCAVVITLSAIAMPYMYFRVNGYGFSSYSDPMGYGLGGMPIEGRSWGPEQATGEPNVEYGGDNMMAWASLETDKQDEWITLSYDEPVEASAIIVHESYNPGALTKITSVSEDGKETTVWEGKDPAVIKNGIGIAEIPVDPPQTLQKIKLYIGSFKVTGWNEIDAVGLNDESGTTHWATEAEASSSYAEVPPGYMPQDPYATRMDALEERIEALEK